MEIKAPTEFCKPSVTIVEDRHCKKYSYEVYFVYKKGTPELFYVGCGQKGRHKHVFSGSSQNVLLNVCYVFSVDLQIFVFGCESKEEALAKEAKGIEDLKPRFNNVPRDQAPIIKVKGKLAVEDLEERFKASNVAIKDIIALALFFLYNLWRNDIARLWFILIAKNSDGKLVAVNTLNGNVDYFYCEGLGGMVQYRPQVLHRSCLIFSKGSETQKRILRDTLKQYWPDIYDDFYKI